MFQNTPKSQPQQSQISTLISNTISDSEGAHAKPFLALAMQVQHNLQYQHQWTDLQLHTHDSTKTKSLARPLLSGQPPTRLYVSHDEQALLLKAGKDGSETRQREWVLPTRLAEKWTLARFAQVFDGIDRIPPGEDEGASGAERVKRVLLAIAGDDGTIVYYFMHDGIVKPRQN